MSAPPKNYEQIAAQLTLDAMIRRAMDSSNGGSLDFVGAPSAQELREKDEAEAREAAENAALLQAKSKEEMLTARLRMMEKSIAKTQKKLAKKMAKAGRP